MQNRKPSHFTRTGRALAAVALLFFLRPLLAQQPDRLALCAACHGPQGISGTPVIPSLAGQPQVFLENQLVLIREGLRTIPEMRGLLDGVSDAELTALASHFTALPPPPAATTPIDAVRFERGKDIAHKALCGTCHLPTYSGREQIPRLAGQQEFFLVYAMRQFRDHAGLGRDTIMSASLYGISDDQLADLAHFFAHFRP
jgi:cytochrome c553